MKTKNNPLRKIARHALARAFGDLAPQTQEDLATSLVRQWVTYEGHAGVITPASNFWFELVSRENGYEVGRDRCDSRVPEMLHACGADEREFRELFHRASLSQQVEFVGRDARRYRLRVDPRERRISVEEATESGEA